MTQVVSDRRLRAETLSGAPAARSGELLRLEGAPDQIFAERSDLMLDFEFDDRTARVFDDMVSRSVPFYGEIQRMIVELAQDFAEPGTRLYDLGCSTGTTLAALDQRLDPAVAFVGIDNAESMLEKARTKLAGSRRTLEFRNADLEQPLHLEDASVALLVLTLQFVRPLRRERLLRSIAEGMRPNGCLLLVEKLTSEHSLLNRLFIKNYYDFKRRNGYSDVEIAQKREALENVLIPYRFEENRDLLLEAGFRHVEVFFRWYNFAALIAVR